MVYGLVYGLWQGSLFSSKVGQDSEVSALPNLTIPNV